METLEIHSKDFLVKWVHAPDNSVIDWQVKPLKRSIIFGIYKKNDDLTISKENSTESFQAPVAPLMTSSDSNNSTSRLRSSSVNSVNQITKDNNPYKTKSRSSTFSSNLSNSDLSLLKNYNKLIAGELVHGKFEVQKGGMYAFIFDNSFSKTTGKKVFFSNKIIADAPANGAFKRKPSIARNTSIHKKGNILRPKNGELLQSILLKKRRKKLQGFTKRYFVLNFKYGTLSYFRVNDNKLRGQMPIRQSIVSANSNTREIIIDSGMEVWNLKALNANDFTAWVEAFNEIKKSSESDSSPEGDYTINEEDDHIFITQELESISSKLSQLRTQQAKAGSSSTLLDSISADVTSLLARVKPGNRASMNELTSVLSNEFYDAQEYLDVMSSGVVLLDTPHGADDRHIDSKISESDNDDVESVSTSSSEDEDEEVTPKNEPEEAEAKESTSDDSDDTLYPLPLPPVERDADIPICNHTPPSILGFVRKNVGKDLSTIAMPVSMNEPITILQKYSEMFEYSDLVNNALQPTFVEESGEKILRIAAFAVSYLSSARVKERNNRKPFSPLLGETFELVREDFGIRVISEKVCHRPPVFAFFAESENWNFSFSPAPNQTFWGKNAEIVTKGTAKLTIKSTGEVFTWSHPASLLKNIIAGEKYTEPSSAMTIKSSSGYKAVVEFAKGGMFSGRSEDLTIKAFNSSKKQLPYSVSGKWTESLTLKTNTTEKLIWEVGDLVPNANKKFGFTAFAATLNKITDIEEGKLAPTDSRLRPDMKVYEEGDVDKAETLKVELEEAQRTRRKEMEESGTTYKPRFFEQVSGDTPDSGEWAYIRGEKSYWNRRRNGDWDDLVKLW
ncbi:Oxysterol-binding protein-domain-containing protein [Scheffersomyces xylosifermentans]|uniref:Oxysterol-binding protein-domain-containing protein n=1 Tax=Scheffersomyces xylosifermentans TaxID=1304137 RepID=UPI00315DB957